MDFLVFPVALVLGVLVVVGLAIYHRLRHGRPRPEDAEYEHLRARLARREITREAYERRRDELRRRSARRDRVA
jgi:uncharacterized membrane protein